LVGRVKRSCGGKHEPSEFATIQVSLDRADVVIDACAVL
jgi:hypothetical protein